MSRVLVVERESPLVRILGWILVEAGHEVVVVTTPELVEPHLYGADFNVVVCNGALAEGARRTAFADWRRTRPGLRIVDVVRPPKVGREYEDAGADEHLMMPFHADDLINAVGRDGHSS